MIRTPKPRNIAIRKQLYWLPNGDESIFSCTHMPDDGSCHDIGVVICNPIGFEYVHSFRTLRFLADRLAAQRIPTVRFDYTGTGNSSGHPRTANLVDRWESDIAIQADRLRNEYGVKRICLVGVRFGSALASLAAARTGASMLVAWEPCHNGRHFSRQLWAASMVSRKPGAEDTGVLESGGFVFSDETINAIKGVQVNGSNLESVADALVINRERGAAVSFENTFEHIDTEFYVGPDFDGMVREPHFTEIPYQTSHYIVEWIISRSHDDAIAHESALTNASVKELNKHERDGYTETVIRTKQSGLVGIYCQPDSSDASDYPLVVLSNGGSVHNIGPNRVYVELSRTLAQRGIRSIRFDLHNLGESVLMEAPDENHPYPEFGTANLAEILFHAKAHLGAERFVLAGLCSGSHTSFHSSLTLRDYDICETIMINPLTFYWRSGMSLETPAGKSIESAGKHYEYALRDSSRWKKLFSGRINYKQLLSFIVRYIAKTINEFISLVLEKLKLRNISQLGKDLHHLRNIGTHISFFFSARDPGLWLLRSEAALVVSKHTREGAMDIQIIDEADHTFSKEGERHEFIERFCEHFAKRYLGRNNS